MRIIEPDDLEQLWNEVKPYLIPSLDGAKFKDNTPDEIKEKFEIWKERHRALLDQ